jgi:hypothetical protein
LKKQKIAGIGKDVKKLALMYIGMYNGSVPHGKMV